MRTGDKIRYYREKLGLTQEDVAKRLRTKPQNIYKYEKGIIENIPLVNIVAMAEMFGISPSELVGWNGPLSSGDENSDQDTKRDIELSDSQILLSGNEKELIRAYRNSPHLHDRIHAILGIPFSRNSENDTNYYQKLPPDFKTGLGNVKVASPIKPKFSSDDEDDENK